MNFEELTNKDVDYDLKIYDLEYVADTKTVTAIFWKCDGKIELEGKEYSSTRQGKVDEFRIDEEEFIEYEDITEEKCLEWLNNSKQFHQGMVKGAILESIKQQLRPPVLNGVPWKTPK